MFNFDQLNWRRRWITSDWHLGEDRMALMMRPFKDQVDNLESIIQRHNSVVEKDDLVIFVGDAINQNKPEFFDNISRLNGVKVLIRGNHDRPYTDEDFKKYFALIVPEGDGIDLEVRVKDEPVQFWATHYPSQAREDKFNLVGHIHSAWKVQLNSINVGVDCNHFYPLDLDVNIPFLYTAIKDVYDDDVWAAYKDANQGFVGKRGKSGAYFSK